MSAERTSSLLTAFAQLYAAIHIGVQTHRESLRQERLRLRAVADMKTMFLLSIFLFCQARRAL